MKPDFQRIQSLLREAVTMLCKNSLPYKSELCVEGLLGITLDREDIFLVNIKEILKSHEFITSVDDINDSKLVIGERSLSPVNSQEEPDNEDSSADCSTVSTRAVVPIFKPPNKVQRSHKRAVSNSSELSRHWFASVDQQASGDSRLSEWEEGVHTPPHTTPPTQHPPHNKRRRLESSHQFNSHETAIDVDSLSVMEVKKEALDENVPSASMTNYRLQHTGDNLSNLNELTNFAAVHMSQGETEAKHVLPVSLPSIAGLTSSSWHMGAGDILSTSMPSLPNLSSDMVSAGLPSSHFNNSVQQDPTIQWLSVPSSNSNESTVSRGWDNDTVTTVDNSETMDNPEAVAAWAVSTLRQWAKDANIDSEKLGDVDQLELLTAGQLTTLLSKFIVEVRQPDGATYTPSKLFLLIAGVQSYLTLRRGDEDVLLSPEPFSVVRRLVDSQVRPAFTATLRPRRPGPASLTPDQEDLLWRCGALGDYNGTVLLHTLVYLNSRNFLIGCGHHHRRLRYANPQITLHEPATGPAYLQYTADGQGAGRTKVVYADPACPSRCHVNIYRKYVEKCPDEGRDPLAFYVAPKRVRDAVVWFSLAPVGHNGLQVIVPDLFKRAQCEEVVMAAGMKLCPNTSQSPSTASMTDS